MIGGENMLSQEEILKIFLLLIRIITNSNCKVYVKMKKESVNGTLFLYMLSQEFTKLL